MANSSYILVLVEPQATKQDCIVAFAPLLQEMVKKALDDRWKVSLADWEDGGPTWLVTLPGTAVTSRPEGVGKILLPPGKDFGFPVTLEPGCISFRSSPNLFDAWAQGRLAEELADHYRKAVHFDATGRTAKPGTREYRTGKTFQEYLARNFDKPLSVEDQEEVDWWKRVTPEGHW